MQKNTKGSWENLLDPDKMRPNLIIGSLYIAAFEILKNTVVDRIQGFFTNGFTSGGPIVDPAYKTDVLARNCNPVYASLDWLKYMNAIDDADIASFTRLKAMRNRFAHELANLLADDFSMELPDRFSEVIHLVDKIERWWIVNVEISVNPDLQGEPLKEEGIIGGSTILLRLMTDVALGSDEVSRRYLKEWNRIAASSRPDAKCT